MKRTDGNQDPDQTARRVTAEHAQDRETARRAVADKNEKAHKAQVVRRRALDGVKADLRKHLEY